jgi:hypothetical protein
MTHKCSGRFHELHKNPSMLSPPFIIKYEKAIIRGSLVHRFASYNVYIQFLLSLILRMAQIRKRLSGVPEQHSGHLYLARRIDASYARSSL